MTRDFYCGIKKDPRKRRTGNMMECAEVGEVRYWGLNKVDERILQNVGVKDRKSKADKIWIKLQGVKGLKKKLETDLIYEKDKEAKKKLKKQIKDVEKERRKLAIEWRDAKEAQKAEEEVKEMIKKSKKSGSKKNRSASRTKSRSGSNRRSESKTNRRSTSRAKSRSGSKSNRRSASRTKSNRRSNSRTRSNSRRRNC